MRSKDSALMGVIFWWSTDSTHVSKSEQIKEPNMIAGH